MAQTTIIIILKTKKMDIMKETRRIKKDIKAKITRITLGKLAVSNKTNQLILKILNTQNGNSRFNLIKIQLTHSRFKFLIYKLSF